MISEERLQIEIVKYIGYQYPKARYGLFIEIKTHKGRPTEVQKQWIQDLQERGYQATIGKGLPECLQIIDDYMNQPNTTTCKCPNQ